MIHQVRVIYGDTDQMGVVYYANHLRFFEASRAAYLRALGRSNKDFVRWGIALPVAEVQCNYKLPAYYEDLLDVHVDVEQVRAASMRFVYTIRRGDDVIATGYTVHACISADSGRPVRFPKELRALIEGDGGG